MSNQRSLRYQVVDVFTRVPLEGNALAVFPDSHGIDDVMKQRIARELNLSETVFIEEATLSGCVKNLRIFTPLRELSFAGHPTIGTAFVLLEKGFVPKSTKHFQVQEKIGPVAVRVEMSEPPLLWLQTPPITFENIFSRNVCAEILQLDANDLLDIDPQIVNAGNPTLLLAVKDKSVVDRASIDVKLFSNLSGDYPEPFCLFVFAPTDEGAYSRMFAPNYGVFEDPATGSSTGPLGAFMKRHNLLPSSATGRFISEQGTKMGRRSLLHFEISEEDGNRVFVGGHVTPLIEAVMTL